MPPQLQTLIQALGAGLSVKGRQTYEKLARQR